MPKPTGGVTVNEGVSWWKGQSPSCGCRRRGGGSRTRRPGRRRRSPRRARRSTGHGCGRPQCPSPRRVKENPACPKGKDPSGDRALYARTPTAAQRSRSRRRARSGSWARRGRRPASEEQGEAEDGPDGPEVVAAADRRDDEQHGAEQAVPQDETVQGRLAAACPAAGGGAGRGGVGGGPVAQRPAAGSAGGRWRARPGRRGSWPHRPARSLGQLLVGEAALDVVSAQRLHELLAVGVGGAQRRPRWSPGSWSMVGQVTGPGPTRRSRSPGRVPAGRPAGPRQRQTWSPRSAPGGPARRRRRSAARPATATGSPKTRTRRPDPGR